MYKELGSEVSTEIYRKNRFACFKMWQYYVLIVLCVILTTVLDRLAVTYVPLEYSKNHRVLYVGT